MSVLLIVLLFMGCDTFGLLHSTSVDFSLEKRAYEIGDTLTLKLENHSPREIGYNLSCSVLERQENGTWKRVPLPYACQDYLAILSRLKAATHRFPVEVLAGQYRFKTEISDAGGGERRSLTTGAFTVTE